MRSEKLLLLYRRSLKGQSYEKEILFVRYKKCVPFSDEVDETVSCVILKPTTAGCAEKNYDVKEQRKDSGAVEADKKFGAVLVQSNASTMHAARVSINVQPFKAERRWSSQRSYIDRLFQESAVRGSRIHQ